MAVAIVHRPVAAHVGDRVGVDLADREVAESRRARDEDLRGEGRNPAVASAAGNDIEHGRRFRREEPEPADRLSLGHPPRDVHEVVAPTDEGEVDRRRRRQSYLDADLLAFVHLEDLGHEPHLDGQKLASCAMVAPTTIGSEVHRQRFIPPCQRGLFSRSATNANTSAAGRSISTRCSKSTLMARAYGRGSRTRPASGRDASDPRRASAPRLRNPRR